jgi:hypothetical protein
MCELCGDGKKQREERRIATQSVVALHIATVLQLRALWRCKS